MLSGNWESLCPAPLEQRIVAESQAGRRQVSATARRYSLSVSQLFTWCRLAREGRLSKATRPRHLRRY